MKITKRLCIGIIGGTGRTGAQFAKLFSSNGFRVRVSGSSTRAKNHDIIASCDLVLFALPLSSAASLMRTALKASKRKDQLILDVSSLKTREVAAMLTAKGEVIGMHPLFGPFTDPKGECIVLCPGRAKVETVRELRALFHRMGVRTCVMTPEEHDSFMSVVQVIPHMKSFLIADVLRGERVDLKKVLTLCTPTYEMEFNTIARFLDDHPDLYMPILFRNPKTLSILKRMKALIDEYIRIAKNKDLLVAEKRYRACQAFFQPHLKRARRHSEACIQTLLSLTR